MALVTPCDSTPEHAQCLEAAQAQGLWAPPRRPGAGVCSRPLMRPAAVHLRVPRLLLALVLRAALPNLSQALRPLRQTRERT